MPNSSLQKTNSPLPPSVAKEFIELQTGQLELASKQLDFQKEVQKNNFEYAKLALHERINSQQQENQVELTLSKWKYIFCGCIILSLLIIVVFSVDKGQVQFAEDIIKTIATLVIGAIGGYGYATVSKRKDKEKK